jgi:hypothetical protein
MARVGTLTILMNLDFRWSTIRVTAIERRHGIHARSFGDRGVARESIVFADAEKLGKTKLEGIWRDLVRALPRLRDATLEKVPPVQSGEKELGKHCEGASFWHIVEIDKQLVPQSAISLMRSFGSSSDSDIV